MTNPADAQRAQAREIPTAIDLVGLANELDAAYWSVRPDAPISRKVIRESAEALRATAALREENARLHEDRNKLIEQHRQRDEQEVDGRLYEMVVAENRELKAERDTLREALKEIADESYDYRRDVREVARAALKEPQMTPQGWQPIATAPKDGTRILGRRSYADRYTGVLRYEKRQTFWGKTSHVPIYGWNYGRDVEDLNLWEPTHWRPMAEPPQ